MRKRIITLLCAAGLAFSAQTMAAGLKVRPDAPARYEVKPGDTLWSISGKFLYSPWQWNRLWGANRGQSAILMPFIRVRCWFYATLTANRAWVLNKVHLTTISRW